MFCGYSVQNIINPSYIRRIYKERDRVLLPHPPPFLGTPVRSGTVKFNRMFLSKAGVQPLELSERAELESPPPLRGALGTILIWRNRHHVASLRLAIAHLMSSSDKFIRHPKVNVPRSAFTTPLDFSRAPELSLKFLRATTEITVRIQPSCLISAA